MLTEVKHRVASHEDGLRDEQKEDTFPVFNVGLIVIEPKEEQANDDADVERDHEPLERVAYKVSHDE